MIIVATKKNVNDKKFELHEEEHPLTLDEAIAIINSNDLHIIEAVAEGYKLGFFRGQAAAKESKITNQ